MHEDAPLLDQLVAQRGQAVGLDQQHEALGLPLWNGLGGIVVDRPM